MTYKSVLTVATNVDKVDATMQGAAALCRQQAAHLQVLALGVDTAHVGYAYVGASAGLLQMALEQVEDTARAIEAKVRDVLSADLAKRHWAVAAAVTQLGALTDLVASRARFADLVILPKPYGAGMGPKAEAVVEAALFEGQAPVLILPDAGLGPLPIETIVIAWNQSREAMAATRRALPFLKRAKLVNIAVIDPSMHGDERAHPGEALCQMLVRHGVKAQVSVLARSVPRIADELSLHVATLNAEMLVMGAYGHSRFREAVMGGATRSMLEQMEVPVLMAH